MFNLLDTPGHEDFSEDTYRTLTAADCAVMVIDAAKGIEAQTRKLFEVCRLRDIPIMTFVNKMDREARDPFELLDEISDQLQIETAPMVWPAGMGLNFKGVLRSRTPTNSCRFGGDERIGDNALATLLPDDVKAKLDEDVELARDGLPRFDLATYREGHLSPVYFGSALKNFGVRELLDALARNAPPPRDQAATRPRRRARRRRSHRLRVQGPGQYGPQSPRPGGVPAAGLGRIPPQHEAEAVGHRQDHRRAQSRSCSSPRSARRWTRPGPATSSAFPITASCASATRCRNRARWSSPAFPISRRKSCAACAWPIR